MMRALALMVGLLALGANAGAALSVGVSTQPGSIISGQDVTVFVLVTNVSAGMAYNVDCSVTGYGNGQPVLVATPVPSSRNIASNGSTTFTWLFQGQGCGQISFSATATGFDGVTVTASNDSPLVPVVCTPSPSPTVSPTSTATPWVIYVTPVEAPKEGDASIPGNLFHPDQGQPLQLKFSAPAEGEVVIELYNRLGQRVRSITRSVQPGSYTELWDGRNDQGLLVAAGIYVAQFRGKSLFKTVKFAVIK